MRNKKFVCQLTTRYAETDQMSFVYYGVYAQYYEIGRVELLRSIGISYKKIEEKGYSLPVVNFQINYIKPAFYDDLITVKTTLIKLPDTKIYSNYKLYNEQNELLNTGTTTLVSLSSQIFFRLRLSRPQSYSRNYSFCLPLFSLG